MANSIHSSNSDISNNAPNSSALPQFDSGPAPGKSVKNKGVTQPHQSSTGNSSGVAQRRQVSKNPYINFVLEFLRTNKQMKGKSAFRHIGEVWRSLSKEEKIPYYEMARSAPKKRKARPQKRSRSVTRRKNNKKDRRN